MNQKSQQADAVEDLTEADANANEVKDDLAQVNDLVGKIRIYEEEAAIKEGPQQELLENLHREHRFRLRTFLATLPTVAVAVILSALPEDDRAIAWKEIAEDRLDGILDLLAEDVAEELIGDGQHTSSKVMINAFELHNGRLRQITVDRPAMLADIKPIWVDLVAPTARVRNWVGKHYGLEIPDPEDLTDLESSARYYVEDNGEVHMRSDFLLDLDEGSRNVAVGFIVHNDILFSVRSEELPVFRLVRLRARSQPGYVKSGTDVLLDLYAADVEYSANALEGVYGELEKVGGQVLRSAITDVEASQILAGVAEAEDINGRTRRSVLDTRRALSFLMRGKLLSEAQLSDVREILRDIESLDGHTAFLFNKINFLMDATDSAININANKKIERLTVLSVVFMPINVLAGMGGMSEYSTMAQAFEWNMWFAYALYTICTILVGCSMFFGLRFFEKRQPKRPRAVVANSA
jgi:magnesium transporter